MREVKREWGWGEKSEENQDGALSPAGKSGCQFPTARENDRKREEISRESEREPREVG